MAFPILSVLTFLPLAGAVLILLLRGLIRNKPDIVASHPWPLHIGILVSLAVFALSLYTLHQFDTGLPGYQLQESAPWFGKIQYRMGIDGLSLSLIVLTGLLTPLALIGSMGSIKTRISEYVVAFLVLETFMIGVFAALDIVLFYIFFEGGLIPMFIIIGIWGGAERVYAAFKFFLYTLLGSLFMLAAIVYMYLVAGTSDIVALQRFAFEPSAQTWLWLAFFASFAVKLPMWPVHTWLPDAHVQAPTGGWVILAAILLKMGGYGFLRFSLPMFPDASYMFQPLMFSLSAIAIVYASLVAWRQTDMKKLIAYSSVAHMGFVTLGIFSFSEIGIQGAVFQMLSHGLISGALFLIVGIVYERTHTREIAAYGGIIQRMPAYAAFFMLFTMASVGLPGTSGFIGEILTMVATFQVSTYAAAGAALGVIFSAVYMLTLYRRVVFGPMTNLAMAELKDMRLGEWLVLAPLALGTLWFGIAPNSVFALTKASSLAIVAMVKGG